MHNKVNINIIFPTFPRIPTPAECENRRDKSNNMQGWVCLYLCPTTNSHALVAHSSNVCHGYYNQHNPFHTASPTHQCGCYANPFPTTHGEISIPALLMRLMWPHLMLLALSNETRKK